MGAKIRVFLLSGNRLLREALGHTLSKRPDMEVLSVESLGPKSCEQVVVSQTDVLVLDSTSFLVDEYERLRETQGRGHVRGIVLVAMEEDERTFLETVRRGATGYVLKEASALDVVAAVRAVAKGEAACPARLCRVLFDYVTRLSPDFPKARSAELYGLTRREQQLIPLIGRGLTNKEIALRLNLSEQTIKNHVHRILKKVGVSHRLSVLEACEIPPFQN